MKKYIFMVLILAITAFGAFAALSVSKVKAEDGKNLQQTERHKSQKNKKKKKDKEAEVEKEKWEKRFYLANYSHIPKEHREAVQKADIYANGSFFSKKRLIWELYTMDRYSKEEIIYALSHIKADWKRNALWTVRISKEGHLARQRSGDEKPCSEQKLKQQIKEELAQIYNGPFTQEEIAYAMNHYDKVSEIRSDDTKWWSNFSSDMAQ